MEMNAFQKKCLDLFKVWSIMKENMMKSGTHDSDPYSFVEVAMRGFMGLTPISVFYFYKWCVEQSDIDSVDAKCLVVTKEVGLDIVDLFLWWCCDCHMVAIKNCNTFCHDMISANR